MKKPEISKIIEKIATQEGVSVAEVRKEMENAIALGLADKSPEVQTRWVRMSQNGKTPTPEDVIAYAFNEITQQ